MPVTRRALLAAGGLTALGAAGCGGSSQGTLRVYVVWSGDELAAFQAVVAEFSRRHHWKVDVLTAGNDITALLNGQLSRRVRPDVVLLPLAGLAMQNAANLAPAAEALSSEELDPFPRAWRRLLQPQPGSDRGDLGIWFKLTHKSLVWYRQDIFDRYGFRAPDTIEEWQTLNGELVGAGVAPLALGAADGWVLTDWFENLLLANDRSVYEALNGQGGRGGRSPAELWQDEAVSRALGTLADLLTPLDEKLPGGARRALELQFQDSVVDVFGRGRAAMVPIADFATPIIEQHASPGMVGRFQFPRRGDDPKPLVVGGDLAVMPKPAGTGAKALLQWLASPDAARIWARRGGFISPLATVGPTAYGSPFRPYYDTELLDAVRDADPLFDLSDQLTGRLGGGDGLGSWQIMQDFLTALGAGKPRDEAVQATVARFADGATGSG